MNSTTQSLAPAAREVAPSPTPPVHCEMMRLRENNSDLSNVIDVLTARLDVVLRAGPPGDQTGGQARRTGDSALHEGLIDQNEVVERQVNRLRDLIDRLTV